MISTDLLDADEEPQDRKKQGSTSEGLGPGHSLSGSTAIVLENSRNILQCTSRSRVPSPHVAEHGAHSPVMKLYTDSITNKLIGYHSHFQN